MDSRPETPCPHCRGTGRLQLTGVYLRTLELLGEQSGPVNGSALAKAAGCKATAMNNRLIALERLGLAVGRRDGRQRLWEVPRA